MQLTRSPAVGTVAHVTEAYDFRRLDDGDATASRQLGREAFGLPALAPDTPVPPLRPGRTRWGVFFGDALVGRLEGLEFGSWFGGRVLPTVGVGGVTVAAEHRGRGLASGMMRQVLDHHRSHGAVISTLFPTAPGYYRGLGYEIVGSYDEVVVPSASLARPRASVPHLRARRATPADASAIRDLYDGWACEQNGPCTRRGPALATEGDGWVDGHDAVTVVEDVAGTIGGFVSWDRNQGIGADAHLSVTDLIAVDEDAHRALWAVLGSFSEVVDEVRLYTSGPDVARYALAGKAWKVSTEDVYMLRVEDVEAALSGITVPFDVTAPFIVAGDPLGVLDGTYELSVADGVTACRRSDDDRGPTFSARGLAVRLAGAQSCANLRRAGLLSGPTTWDREIDHVLGGRQVHVRDYF